MVAPIAGQPIYVESGLMIDHEDQAQYPRTPAQGRGKAARRLPQALAKELPDPKRLEQLMLEETNRE